jgi:hypothetical protein
MAGHGFCLQTKNRQPGGCPRIGSLFSDSLLVLPDEKMLDYKYQSDLRQALDYKICFFKWRKVDKIAWFLFI